MSTEISSAPPTGDDDGGNAKSWLLPAAFAATVVIAAGISYIAGAQDSLRIGGVQSPPVGVYVSGCKGAACNSQGFECLRFAPVTGWSMTQQGFLAALPDMVGATSSSCPEGVLAFAKGKGLARLSAPGWHSGVNAPTISMEVERPLPLKLWLVGNDVDPTWTQDPVRWAGDAFRDNSSGIDLVDGEEPERVPVALGTTFHCSQCPAAAAVLLAGTTLKPCHLNVFFVRGLQGDAGCWCSDQRIAMVDVEQSDTSTLAHEIGHALSLDHYLHNVPLNIMRAGTIGRNAVTHGQSYRSNFNSTSVMQLLPGEGALTCQAQGLAPEEQVNCPDDVNDGPCPSIQMGGAAALPGPSPDGESSVAMWIDPDDASPLTEAESSMLNDWILCDDCGGDQLTALATLQDRVVPTLERAVTEQFPKPVEELLRKQLRKMHGELLASFQRGGREWPVSVERFEAHYIGNLKRRVAVRSAKALGTIATPAARNRLEQARKSVQKGSKDPRVLSAIDAALKE